MIRSETESVEKSLFWVVQKWIHKLRSAFGLALLKMYMKISINSIYIFQGLMDKKTLYMFAIQIARFKIPPHEHSKCQQSFFRFARELTSVRLNMANPEQQIMFDEEVIN